MSDHLPTVEIRISDVPATVEETMTLATLVQALVGTASAAITKGEAAPAVDHELLRAACWRAARDGLDGRSLDVESVRLLTAHQAVRQLVDHVEPALTAFGEFEQVTASLDKVFSNGNGAIVQRRQLTRRSRVADVIDECARRTFEGCSSQGVSDM